MELTLLLPLLLLVGAILIDLMIGDPRWLPHPVVGMGKLISFFERLWNTGRWKRIKGVILTITIVGLIYILAYLLLKLVYGVHLIAGLVIEGYLISTTMAIKGLKDAAMEVSKPLQRGELLEARKKLSMIVGRDTEELEESELVRGTVETVAENTVDGITAPLLFALLGGAPLALAYRAVNTLDSMVGYKNQRFKDFGWASARLDDLCNWIPARVTALCMWLAAWMIKGSMIRGSFSLTLRDAPKHPSPNSGWTEALIAALLGVQLGGINKYQGLVSERARMGEKRRELEVEDIHKAILYMHGGWILFLLLLSIGYFIYSKQIS